MSFKIEKGTRYSTELNFSVWDNDTSTMLYDGPDVFEAVKMFTEHQGNCDFSMIDTSSGYKILQQYLKRPVKPEKVPAQ